jgi:hypothetical protein
MKVVPLGKAKNELNAYMEPAQIDSENRSK